MRQRMRLMKTSNRLLVSAALCLLLLAACSKEEPVEPQRMLTPDFILTDLDGEDFQLSKYQGQVVLLNFFLTT